MNCDVCGMKRRTVRTGIKFSFHDDRCFTVPDFDGYVFDIARNDMVSRFYVICCRAGSAEKIAVSIRSAERAWRIVILSLGAESRAGTDSG